MTLAENESPDALPIEYFLEDARAIGAIEFRAEHGDGFLLHEGPLQAARRAVRAQPTMVVSQSAIGFPWGNPSTAPPDPKLQRVLVFPVRYTGRSPFPRIVTLGRTRNNDIVIADVSISKFHAFFREEGESFVVQDAGSRNGTFVDSVSVPDAKHGKPALVKPGANARFGAVELKFVSGAQLRELVLKRAR